MANCYCTVLFIGQCTDYCMNGMSPRQIPVYSLLSLVNKYPYKLYPCIISELISITLMLYKTPPGEACVRCPDLKPIFQRKGREEEATTACSTTNLSAPDYRNNPHPHPCQRLEWTPSRSSTVSLPWHLYFEGVIIPISKDPPPPSPPYQPFPLFSSSIFLLNSFLTCCAAGWKWQ